MTETPQPGDEGFKTWENLVRRKAKRQGLTLHKSRLRDPRAKGFGRYWLADPGSPDTPPDDLTALVDLDTIEKRLNGESAQ